MRTAESILIRRSHLQHRVVSRAQLLDDGLSDTDINRMRRRDILVRTLVPGVYGVGAAPDDPASRLVAATLGVKRSAAFRRTAARVLDLPATSSLPVEPLEIVTPYGGTSSSPWADVHRTRHLPDRDVTEHGPFRVTTAARTFCDLGAVLGFDRLRHLGQKLLVERVVELDDLLGCASNFVRRGRPGSQRVRDVMAFIDDGEPIADSTLEMLFIEQAVVPYGLPLQRQFRPPWYDGWRGVTDFAEPVAQLVVEVDGRPWHQIAQDLAEDRRRDRLAMRHGYLPMRYTASEIRRDPESVAAEIMFHIGERAA